MSAIKTKTHTPETAAARIEELHGEWRRNEVNCDCYSQELTWLYTFLK